MTKNKNSVQGLIGLERFTRFGVKSDKAEIAFFSVEPTNISVLSAANIDVKIHHLMMLLSTIRSHISRYSCRASRLWTVPLRLCAVRTRHLSLYSI